jgi:hypothetical protein
MVMDPMKMMLEFMRDQARKDRDDANARGSQFTVDEKRALANAVTKLDEAIMWRERARGYFERR